MILSMSDQASLFLTTIIIGICIAFVYDWIRVLRNIIRHPNFIMQLEDGLYWISVSLFIFFIMLNKNYGEIRAFSICGVFLGMIIYFFTISYYFMKFSLSIVNFLKKIIILIIKIILTPIKLILKLLNYPYCLLKGIFGKFYLSNKKTLRKYKKCARMKKDRVLKDIKIIFRKI